MNFQSIFWVALGGAAGAVSRYCLAGLILRHAAGCRFPVSTFVVNLAGCLLAGLLSGLAAKHGFFSAEARVFLFTGLLGGFTTFSAFGLETFHLLRQHEVLLAAGYMLGSVLFGVLFVGLGFWLVAVRQ